MIALLKRIVINLGKVVTVIAIIIGIFWGWTLWDTHKLETFCSTVPVGYPTSKLRTLLQNAGYKSHWIDNALKTDDPPGYVAFIPSVSTFGEESCAIYFNKSEVTSAGIKW